MSNSKLVCLKDVHVGQGGYRGHGQCVVRMHLKDPPCQPFSNSVKGIDAWNTLYPRQI